jgi:uncharacterized membrane protein YdjX (TVP38/TMEM64 family)
MTARVASFFRAARPARRLWILLALALALLAALAAAWRYTALSELLTGEHIREWVLATRRTRWAPLVLIAAYTPAAWVMFPRPVITLIGVLAFGAWLGFVYAMTGILLCGFVAYCAGRSLPTRIVERLAGRHYAPARKALERHGLAAVLIVRILPSAPDVIESLLAGALRVPAWQFGLGTALGMLPGVLTASVFGGQIAGALEEPSAMQVVIALGALAAFALSALWLRRWAARR